MKFDIQTVSLCLGAIQSRGEAAAKLYNAATIDRINAELDKLPHGSGIDGNNELGLGLSKPEKLVFKIPFHHMDENGFYAGWDIFKVIAVPSFSCGGVKVTVRYYSIGSDVSRYQRTEIKDYLGDLFSEFFNG